MFFLPKEGFEEELTETDTVFQARPPLRPPPLEGLKCKEIRDVISLRVSRNAVGDGITARLFRGIPCGKAKVLKKSSSFSGKSFVATDGNLKRY